MNKEEKTKLINAVKYFLQYITVDSLEVSIRTSNILKMANIKDLRDLTEMDEYKFLKLYGCGRKTLNEIKCVMDDLGIKFGMEWPKYDWVYGLNMIKKLDELKND